MAKLTTWYIESIIYIMSLDVIREPITIITKLNSI